MKNAIFQRFEGSNRAYDAAGYPDDGHRCDDVVIVDGHYITKLAQEGGEILFDCLQYLEKIFSMKDEAIATKFNLPICFVKAARVSYENGHPQIIGRFDLARGFDPFDVSRVIENNADTPFCIFETAVIQDYLRVEKGLKEEAQYNWIFTDMVKAYRKIANIVSEGEMAIVGYKGSIEDELTSTLLADAASEAGITSTICEWSDLYFNNEGCYLVDVNDVILKQFKVLQKQIPWEILIKEDALSLMRVCNLIENDLLVVTNPPWVQFLQSKLSLTILSDFGKNWLTTRMSPEGLDSFVKKSIYGREGCDIHLYENGELKQESVDTEYAQSGYIYQAKAEFPVDKLGRKYQTGLFYCGLSKYVDVSDACSGVCYRRTRNAEDSIITSNSEIFSHFIFEELV